MSDVSKIIIAMIIIARINQIISTIECGLAREAILGGEMEAAEFCMFLPNLCTGSSPNQIDLARVCPANTLLPIVPQM